MVINGISQNGSPIGVSNARIMLFLPTYNNNFDFLEVYDCTDVGIYGLAMISTYKNSSNYKVNGISYVRCHNLQIGRPGDGNYVFGCTNSIYSNTGTYGSYVEGDTSRQLTIQSNVIGLDMVGGFSNMYQSTVVTYMYHSLLIINTSDIIIGGDDPSEGNTIVFGMQYPGYSFTGINFLIETYRNQGNGILKIKNNKLGTRIDGTLDPKYVSVPVLIFISGAESDYALQFNNNILQGQININSMGSYFTIQGNTIFAARINTIYDCAITLSQNNGGGLIGGDLPGQPNTIYNNYFDTLYYFEDNTFEASIRYDLQSHTTIRNNITLCNSYHSSGIMDNENNGALYQNAWAQIDSTGVNFVKGKATPNTRIDVYLDDDCFACEGKKYLGFTMSNGDSTWQYTGVFNTAVVATSTSLANGQTSMFSSPEIVDYFLKIKQPTCGKKNGYIKGLQITGGDNVKWHYMYKVNGNWRDSVIATTIDLNNAGPGIYFFDAWIGKTCRSYFKQYQLYDQSPKLDTSQVKIQNPGCGQLNGAITNITLSSYQDIKITWIDKSGITVGNQLDLTNAGPGKYKLIIMDTIAGCGDSTFFYSLINQSGPSLITDGMQIGNSTCNKNNGFIKNITYQKATGNIYIAWEDSTGQIVGNNMDLTGIVTGKYLLKFKDGSGCDTIVTPYYIIKDTGNILYDSSHMIVKGSSCKGADGAITGITSTNATVFNWINTATGNIAGNNEDLTNVTQGSYQLQLSNTLGCEAETSPVLVGQDGIIKLTPVNVSLTEADCDVNNGAIQISRFSNDTSYYSFEWIDSVSNNLISTNKSIQNLSPGFYILYATDSNGCKQRVYAAGIQQLGKPEFDTQALQILGDTCNSGKGAIKNLLMKDSSRSYTWIWYNQMQQQEGNASNYVQLLHEGDYYASVTDQFNCTVNSNLFNVPNIDIIPEAPQVTDLYIPRNTSATIMVLNPKRGTYDLLNDNVAGSFPITSSTNGLLQTPLITTDRSFYVRISDGDCRSALSLVNIKVFDSTLIYVPNGFTPNNDGINDRFQITVQGRINKFSISVYNKWGNLVYSGNNINQSWDGTINGIPVPIGVYVYIINAISFDNKNIRQNGTITLLR